MPSGVHFICGLNFWDIPGKYPLPYFEGHYFINSNQYGEYYLTMNTNGNSQIYCHRLSTYRQADRTINCGSVQYFSDFCTTQ